MRKPVSLLVLVLSAASLAAAQEPLARRPYRFDAGAREAAADRLPLPADARYEPARRFGWTEPPAARFERPALERLRPEWLRDGVAGRAIGFRADVPPGDWWVTLWVEAGVEDSSTLRLELDGRAVRPEWQAFNPPAEPRTEIQRIHRLFHGRVPAGPDGLRFRLAAGQDSVRLLGFTLHPDPQPASDEHRRLAAEMERLGRYGAEGGLDSLRARLDALLARRPDDAFAAYWREQAALLAEAERLLAMRGWARSNRETGVGIFDRLHQAVMILDGLLDRPDQAAHPFYDRALLSRARILYWLDLERGGYGEAYGARRDVRALQARHPDDPLVRMYAGERVDEPDACDALKPDPAAPEWSNAQRESLCRLRAIAGYWVGVQDPNGEFGGKLDDDVELLRWWAALILSGDRTALEGWRRLADGVWASDWIEDGYSRRPIDVEHASELIADTQPTMVVFTDDPAYLDRLRPSARHFERLWTGLTPGGRRHFRAAWFGSTEVDDRPPRDRDVAYNTRAVKAIRYLAWKTGDPRVIGLLHEWSRAWAHAAARTDKGKPAGLFPASVRFSDEAINGDEPTWYRANMFWDYFDWRGGGMMLDQLFFTYTLTGDASLLEPLYAALSLVRDHPEADGRAEPGSAAWAAGMLRKDPAVWSAAAHWRLYTGDARFDDLLLRHGTPYLRYRISGDESHLAEATRPILERVRYNVPLLTTEAIHTDRVYVTGTQAPGTNYLKAMLTADGAEESMSPYYAVSWRDTGAGFTALVADSGPDRLEVKLFSHDPAPARATMLVWQLQEGAYRLHAGDAPPTVVRVERRGQQIPLDLPAGRLHTVRLERVPPPPCCGR